MHKPQGHRGSLPAPPPHPQLELITAMEGWYLESIFLWRERFDRSPTVGDLSRMTSKSPTAVRSAIGSLEAKGYLFRIPDGNRLRFRPTPAANTWMQERTSR